MLPVRLTDQQESHSAQRRTLVTRLHEFHLDGTTCVAVRDRSGGQWLSHRVLNCELGGAARMRDGQRFLSPLFPKVGELAWFEPQHIPYVSGPLLAIETPSQSSIRLKAVAPLAPLDMSPWARFRRAMARLAAFTGPQRTQGC